MGNGHQYMYYPYNSLRDEIHKSITKKFSLLSFDDFRDIAT